jgi:hypothetical protein
VLTCLIATPEHQCRHHEWDVGDLSGHGYNESTKTYVMLDKHNACFSLANTCTNQMFSTYSKQSKEVLTSEVESENRALSDDMSVTREGLERIGRAWVVNSFEIDHMVKESTSSICPLSRPPLPAAN